MHIINTLLRAAQVRPDHPATIFKGRIRTYRQVLDRITRLAGSFNRFGLKDEDRIGILSQNSDRYYEYSFAVPWSGRTMVPLNTRLALPELFYMVEDSEVKVLFFDDAQSEKYPEFKKKAGNIEHFIYMGDSAAPEGAHVYEDLIAENNPVPDAGRRMDELLGIYYTGGTTGLPKGVMLSHGNLSINLMTMLTDVGFTPDTHYLYILPMFHLAAIAHQYAMTAIAGTHHFFPMFDIDNLLKVIDEEKITYIPLAAMMVNILLNHPRLHEYDISSLKNIAYGTSPIPEPVLRKAVEILPDIKFVQIYGQTEVGGVISVLRIDDHVFDGPKAGKLGSAGKPTYSIAAKIVDPDDNEVPRGQNGEITCRSPGIMMGYLNNPDQTAQTLRNGWLHTGDIGYMDEDGYVFVVDRVKDMIVTGGENVHSSEVENAIAAHPGISEIAVIAIPSEKWGEQIHAIVVPKPGEEITEQDIINHCKKLIAGYKCPKSVEVRSEPRPLSGVGKIQKNILREPYWKGKKRKVS